MRIRVWGCRGSIAAPGADTARYGGNTSCVEVRLDDGTQVEVNLDENFNVIGQENDDDGPNDQDGPDDDD